VRDRSTYEQIDTSTLEVLLKHDADVNGCSDVSELALLLAVDDGLTKHVKLLIAHGADAYFRDKNGRTALDIAAEHGYTDLVELFLRRYPKLLPLAGVRCCTSYSHSLKAGF
jgi:ankyrin repeat protein